MKPLRNRWKAAEENKKGFTLVEIVVVLVIIAILATLMLGALNGYIDKAKEKTVIANCRTVVLASETVISEKYAAGTLGSSGGSFTTGDTDIAELTKLPSNAQYTVSYDGSGDITNVVYKEGSISAVYNPTTGTITTSGTN